MRYMSIVRSREKAFGPPPPALFQAINEFGAEARAKGVKLEPGGLMPSETGAIVRLSKDGTINVTDGPFSEAKEILGGFAIYTDTSKEDVVMWARKFLEIHKRHWPGWEGECEIRQMFDMPPAP